MSATCAVNDRWRTKEVKSLLFRIIENYLASDVNLAVELTRAGMLQSIERHKPIVQYDGSGVKLKCQLSQEMVSAQLRDKTF